MQSTTVPDIALHCLFAAVILTTLVTSYSPGGKQKKARAASHAARLAAALTTRTCYIHFVREAQVHFRLLCIDCQVVSCTPFLSVHCHPHETTAHTDKALPAQPGPYGFAASFPLHCAPLRRQGGTSTGAFPKRRHGCFNIDGSLACSLLETIRLLGLCWAVICQLAEAHGQTPGGVGQWEGPHRLLHVYCPLILPRHHRQQDLHTRTADA